MDLLNSKMARKMTTVILIIALLISFIPVIAPADDVLAASKSLYVIQNMNAGSPISAYAIQPSPTYLTWQQNSGTTRYGGSGLAIDTDSAILFVTFENSGTLDIVDAINLNKLGQVTAPNASNLAGIVVDQEKQKVYAVDRNTDHLYVYSWNATAHTLTNDITSPPYYVTLPGIHATGWHGDGAHGIALDEVNDLLYVTDVSYAVKIFNTADWSSNSTITASQKAMGIALDVPNELVYTGNAYPGYGSAGLLCKYDLNSNSETATRNIRTLPGGDTSRDCVIGLAVDQDTGLLYITTGNQGGGGSDRIIVFDSSLNMLHATGDIGDPTGIVVPGKPISYNPLNLAKTDGLADDDCVGPGDTIHYTISYDNQNPNPVTGVIIKDTLAEEVTLVDASSGYSYDDLNRLISWNIGTVGSGDSGSVWIDVTVNAGTPGGTTITNQCSIECTETGPAYESEETVTCTNNPPVANDDSATTDEDTPVTIDVLANDSDVDGDALVISSVTTPANGTVVDNGDGTVTYTPDPNYNGNDSFDYTVDDGNGGTDTATVTIKVNAVNDPPNASQAYADPSCLWPPNHKFVDISILGVTDPEDDPVTITITGITSDEPTASDKGSGGAKHAPDAAGVGTDTASVRAERSGKGDGRVYEINFTASDGQGGEATGSVGVSVPHDQKSKKSGECPAGDSGQNYDATKKN